MQERLEIVTHPLAASLTKKGYDLRRGWNTELASALVEHSREPHILQATPRDARERFATTEDAQEWYKARQRIVYGLFHAAELAGVIWYGNDPLPGHAADFTFAVRLYESARGKGLATPFLLASEADFRQYIDYNDALWLTTGADNKPAQAVYTKAGYTAIEKSDDRILMTKRVTP